MAYRVRVRVRLGLGLGFVDIVDMLPAANCGRLRLQTTEVSLNHDGTDGSDGTGIQSVSPVPSASTAGPSVLSVSNSRSN